MQRLHRAALVASTACMFALPAMATDRIAGFSLFSGVQFSLLDSTPADGHAAYYELANRANSFNTAFRFGDVSGGALIEPVFPVPIDSSFMIGTSEVALTSNGQLGDIRNTFFSGIAPADGDHALTTGYQSVRILLSAHSILTISGEAIAAVATQDGTTTSDVGQAWLEARLDRVSVVEQGDALSANLSLDASTPSLNFGEAFSFTVDNTRDFDIELMLSFSTGTYYENLAAVPEPGTWAMMVAGAMVLAGARWRGRQGTAETLHGAFCRCHVPLHEYISGSLSAARCAPPSRRGRWHQTPPPGSCPVP